MTKKGFTLIELMVVVMIIGILTTLVVINVNASRLKARDADRISDITAIRDALEMYADYNNGQYITSAEVCSSGASFAANLGALVPTYIPLMPNDPRNSQTPATYNYCYESSGTEYKVWAALVESREGAAKAKEDGGNRPVSPYTACTNNPPTAGCSYELFSGGGQSY